MGNPKSKGYVVKPYKDFESYGFIKDGKHYFTPVFGGNDRIDSVAGITMCMLSHPAYKDLKPRQRQLYLYAKAQYKGMVDRKKFEEDHPEYKGHPEYIYLNYKLLVDVFEAYSKNNRAEMYRDIAVLVEHGFLEPVIRENNQRTIYKLISEWQSWTPHKKYLKRETKYEWVEL